MSQPQRIHQLSAMVANQIAAGEVIERPASVVKELLENALDAGADTLSLEIGFGGLNLIRVSDNGQGIIAEDLPLTVMAHATSKIKTLDDLYLVKSMGFRGEALASIAAISRLTVQSRPRLQAHAMMLSVDEHGAELSPCARSSGTTIEVRDLFFNTPVRKKFLKSEQIEYQALESVIKRFALSAPQVALTVQHNGKQMLVLPAAVCESTQLLRVKKILGKSFVEQAVSLEVERAGMNLHGWVSGLDYQRSQSDKQWVYINGRMVKDKLLYHAIKQAYEDSLHPGRYPACVLYLTMSTQEVDVNVHPTKHEVRFQQPRLVHDFITSSIRQALRADLTVENACRTDSTILAPSWGEEMATTVNESTPAYTMSCDVVNVVGSSRSPLNSAFKTKDDGDFVAINAQFALLFLTPKQSYLVDVERILHYQLEATLCEQHLPLAHRPLLVPVKYTLEVKDTPFFEDYLPALIAFGIQMDFLSATQVMVRTIPVLLPLLDIEQLLRRLREPEFKMTAQVLTESERHQKALLKLLVTCHPVNAYQLSSAEKMALIAYVQHQEPHTTWLKTACIALDVAKCRALLNG